MTIGCNDFTARERDGHGHGRGCGVLEPGPWSASWNWRSDPGDGQEPQAARRGSDLREYNERSCAHQQSARVWRRDAAFRKLSEYVLLSCSCRFCCRKTRKILCQSIIPMSKHYSHSLAGFVELFVSIDELQVFFSWGLVAALTIGLFFVCIFCLSVRTTGPGSQYWCGFGLRRQTLLSSL
jgi:hypothetical protein